MHKHTVVAYFSATGTTERVAKKLAEATGATLYEIKPAQPYTAADLNWNDPHSRSSQEAHDPAARQALAGKLPDLSSCTCLFLGFPVWWDQPPAVILSFLDKANIRGKTIVPFVTTGGSEVEPAASKIRQYCPHSEVIAGRRFSASVSGSALKAWADKIPG